MSNSRPIHEQYYQNHSLQLELHCSEQEELFSVLTQTARIKHTSSDQQRRAKRQYCGRLRRGFRVIIVMVAFVLFVFVFIFVFISIFTALITPNRDRASQGSQDLRWVYG